MILEGLLTTTAADSSGVEFWQRHSKLTANFLVDGAAQHDSLWDNGVTFDCAPPRACSPFCLLPF